MPQKSRNLSVCMKSFTLAIHTYCICHINWKVFMLCEPKNPCVSTRGPDAERKKTPRLPVDQLQTSSVYSSFFSYCANVFHTPVKLCQKVMLFWFTFKPTNLNCTVPLEGNKNKKKWCSDVSGLHTGSRLSMLSKWKIFICCCYIPSENCGVSPFRASMCYRDRSVNTFHKSTFGFHLPRITLWMSLCGYMLLFVSLYRKCTSL